MTHSQYAKEIDRLMRIIDDIETKAKLIIADSGLWSAQLNAEAIIALVKQAKRESEKD